MFLCLNDFSANLNIMVIGRGGASEEHYCSTHRPNNVWVGKDTLSL